MKTVHVHKRRALGSTRVGGVLRWAVLAGLVFGQSAEAQVPKVHWLNADALPPGAIGSQRLLRGGPLHGYFQPVEIRAPEGARISLAMDNGFTDTNSNVALAGMQVGPVYRLKVADIPHGVGGVVYPTVELIDRLYPPPGQALRFPIPIELTQEELELALRGAFVTRVIYVEDPNLAAPVARKAGDEQPWFEAPAGQDPLVIADGLGRPIAILRIGGRTPADGSDGCGDSFNYGTPPIEMFDESQRFEAAANVPPTGEVVAVPSVNLSQP